MTTQSRTADARRPDVSPREETSSARLHQEKAEAMTIVAQSAVAKAVGVAEDAVVRRHTGIIAGNTTVFASDGDGKGKGPTPALPHEPGPGASPRSIGAGGDLKGNFLAAVGNTMSHTAPLGSPAINPDEMSSSSDSEPETPRVIPQRTRRMSSITRAEQAALSLSKVTLPPIIDTGRNPTGGAGARNNVDADERGTPVAGFSRVAVLAGDVGEFTREKYLTAAPAYPGGVGGRLVCSEDPLRGINSGSPGAMKTAAMRYSMVFTESARQSDLAGSTPRGGGRKAPHEVDVPVGLEAVRDGVDGGLCIRTVGGVTKPRAIIARVVPLRQPGSGPGGGSATGAHEDIFSVVLSGDRDDAENAGCGGPGEVMVVRVSTLPTGPTAPREVRAVLVLPDRTDAKEGTDGMGRVPVWVSSEVDGPDGLWQASAQGRVREGATKLLNKAAVWSPSKNTFELDLLEAWRPGRPRPGPLPGGSSPSAPETMQIVIAPTSQTEAGNLAEAGNSSARSRLPVMQVVRTTTAPVGRGGTAAGDQGSATGAAGYGENDGPGWMVAVAAPMSALQGFALAVIGMETRTRGAPVCVVDRAAATAEDGAEEGFVGFQEVHPATEPDTGGGRGGGRSLDEHSGRGSSSRSDNNIGINKDSESLFRQSQSSRIIAGSGATQVNSMAGKNALYDETNSGWGGDLPASGGGKDTQGSGGASRAGGGEMGYEREGPVAGTMRSVSIPVKRRTSVQAVAAEIVDKVYRNTYVCNLCLLTLVVSCVADLYPGVPASNAPFSAALLWASCNVDVVRALRRRSFAYALSVLVLLSLFVDVVFLLSDVKGIHALNLLWRRFKLFLPIWGSPRKLTKEVYNRIVALAWVHLFSGVALVIMAGIAGLTFNWAPQVASAQGAGVPVSVICIVKSMTNLLVAAALFRNMDLALCLNVFGCLACFQSWHRAREQRRRHRHGVTYPKVILEWDYIMLCAYIKIFDLLVGFWLWVGLGWAWSEDRDYSERHSIRMLLLAITTVQTLTDIWCVFLGITVCLLVSQYLLRKEKSAGNARDAFGRVDGESGRAPASGRLLAVSPDSSAYEAGGRAWGENFPSGGEELESDDDDSYSTGSSETDTEVEQEHPVDNTNSGGSNNNRNGSNEYGSREVVAQPSSAAIPGVKDAAEVGGGPGPPRRRSLSVFAPGGNRLVYKRAFSARSSSDDSTVDSGRNGLPPLPALIALDRSFVAEVDHFQAAWASLQTCASFRCRIGSLPDVDTVARHLRAQGFFVVALGVVSAHTKIYACAKGIEISDVFYAELVFEKAMNELAFTFKCRDERLVPRFVCHLHLRHVIGDHQPIA